MCVCVCGVYMRVSEREPQSLCGSIYNIITHIATLLVYVHNIYTISITGSTCTRHCTNTKLQKFGAKRQTAVSA